MHFSRFKDILFYIIFFSLNIFQYQISIPIEMKNFESFLGLIKNLLKRRKIGANIDNAIDWKPTLKCFALRLKYFLCKEKVEAFHLIVRHKIWQLSNCEIQLSKCWLTYRSHLKSIWNHLSYSFIYYSFFTLYTLEKISTFGHIFKQTFIVLSYSHIISQNNALNLNYISRKKVSKRRKIYQIIQNYSKYE